MVRRQTWQAWRFEIFELTHHFQIESNRDVRFESNLEASQVPKNICKIVERAAVIHSVQPGDFASIFWWIGSQAGIRPCSFSVSVISHEFIRHGSAVTATKDAECWWNPRRQTHFYSWCFAARSGHQKTWDLPLIKVKFEAVMNIAQNQADRARLIVVSSRHAGDFLNAFPSSTVGTRLDNMSLRIAVALRLGANVCALHVCVCGRE